VNLGEWRYKDWSWEQFNVDTWWAYDDKTTGWIIPSTNYMTTGDMSWFDTETPHTNIFAPPLNQFGYYPGGPTAQDLISAFHQSSASFWTNYITLPITTWRTTTNYTTEAVAYRVVAGVTNTITNITYSTTNYVNTGFREDPYLAQVGGLAVAMKTAWERNLYFDEVVDNGKDYIDVKQARDAPVFWSTNVYNDFGRALSVLQWVRDYQQAKTNIEWYSRYWTVQVNVAPPGYWPEWEWRVTNSWSCTTNFSTAQPFIGFAFSAPYYGYTNSQAWGRTVFYTGSNSTPFTVDTFQFQVVGPVVNTNAPAYSLSRPETIESLAAGEIKASGWWPWEPAALWPFIDDFARTNSNNSGAAIHFSANIPYDCYHVQFTALTNYLDHAPAR
jgi:hypothetical protein